MDIAALASAMAISDVQSAYGVAMLSSTLDAVSAAGNQVVEMIDTAAMERSVYPHIGGNFDMTV